MSSTKFEYLNIVQKGRTDWRVKVRIIREWRGKNQAGQPFKGYNLLLLDAKVYVTPNLINHHSLLSLNQRNWVNCFLSTECKNASLCLSWRKNAKNVWFGQNVCHHKLRS